MRGRGRRTSPICSATARDVSEREELRAACTEVDALYRIADAIARATSLDDLFDEASTRSSTRPAPTAPRSSSTTSGGVMRFRRVARALRRVPRGRRRATRRGRRTPSTRSPCSSRTSPRPGFEPDLEAASCARASARSPSSRSSTTAACSGKFMLYRDAPHEWRDREVRLCRTIANHLASATVRTRARGRPSASRASSSRRSCAPSTRGSSCSRPPERSSTRTTAPRA